MKFEDMKLVYGYPLQLQTSGATGQPERFSCRLIGCLPGRSILLSVPKSAGKLVRFRPGQKVVARLMVDNGIGIFASVVEVQTADPYPILHIGYPDNVSFKGIRGATRVAVEQAVVVTNLSKTDIPLAAGSIMDISVTGARLGVTAELGDIGDKLQLSFNVNVAGIARELAIEAIIRSRVEGEQQAFSDEITYGVEFIAPPEDGRLLLYAYVYAQICSEEIIGS
jgi:hypothetical protein